MARTGLYQSEVKKARDSLIALGKHPSVDAVRVALGNTGSKTTIHKYLKELEQQDGGTGGRKASITEALQDLVERLAAQLHEEATARIATIEQQCAETIRRHVDEQGLLKHALGVLEEKLQQAEADARTEKSAHLHTRTALHNESIARHTAEQKVVDLKDRLVENDEHRQSLEEKHKHAREALDHYRQSVKEQRDQDQRRHEQQVQQMQAEARQLQQSLVIKQDDLTRLNQEGARLVADLSHAQTALYEQQTQGRQLAQQVSTLQDAAQQAKVLAAQLAAAEARTQELAQGAEVAAKRADSYAAMVRELELALVAAQATLASQHEVASELRAHLASWEQKAPGKPESPTKS